MKKTYISPVTELTEMETMQMIAESIIIDDDERVAPGEADAREFLDEW